MNYLKRFQNPETEFGKSLRDGVLFALSAGAVAFLQSIDSIDFGAYNGLITALVGFLVPTLNRVTR
jgi:hypothetical protein